VIHILDCILQQKFWKDYYKYFVAGSILFTVFLSIHTLVYQFKYVEVEAGNSTTILTISSGSFRLIDPAVASVVVIATFTLIGLITNSATFMLWRKHKIQIPSKYHDYELKLIFLTAIIYSLHFLSFLYNSTRTILFTDPIKRYLFYGILSDMVALIPNCAILVASPTLRTLVVPDWVYDKICKFYEKLPIPNISSATSLSTNSTTPVITYTA